MTQSENDAAIIRALRASHYPGARDDSLYAVLAYCRAMRVDPMLKPVHIVPMPVKDQATGREEWRDVIMPGIGLYRIIADRSGCYAGKSAPEFGPVERYRFGDQDIDAPAWCDVTVRKMIAGGVVEFTAREYFVENAATTKSGRLNAMWQSRRRGQLAKCAEAQALRQAFPDSIPAGPTADERIVEAPQDDIVEVAAIAAPARDLQAEQLAAELARKVQQPTPEPVPAPRHAPPATSVSAAVFSRDDVAAMVEKLERPDQADEILDIIRTSDFPDDVRRELTASVHQTMRARIRGAGRNNQEPEK